MVHSLNVNKSNPIPRVGLAILIISLVLPSSGGYSLSSMWHPVATSNSESLVVPFAGGIQAVTTGNEYSGSVTLTVTGIGQASGTAYTDAFYLLTDSAGNPVPPTIPNGWTLAINGNLAKELIPGQQVPAYQSNHSYTFQIDAPGGRLTFGVHDTYTLDNTGSYSVIINNGTSGCTVPFFSQRDPDWKGHPLLTNENPETRCSEECNTIGACGCTLTSTTMLFAYYGAPVTPAQVSDCMGSKACPFNWGAGAACSQGKAEWSNIYNFSWDRLDYELNQNGHPVILGMYKKVGNKTYTHWVLVISGHGNDPSGYLVNDPWPLAGANTNLNVLIRSGYVLKSLSIYNGKPSCAGTVTTQVQSGDSVVNTLNPTGSIVSGTVDLWHADETALVVKLSATSTAGQITEMQVWTDSRPASGWQTFDEYAWTPWQPDDHIYARFRDEYGNTSDDSSDSMFPESSPSEQSILFLPISVH
jgi:hypothetical protein